MSLSELGGKAVMNRPAYAAAGRPCPVFMAGIEYRSILKVGEKTGLAPSWLTRVIKKNNGAPVVVKGRVVVIKHWIQKRMNKGIMHERN
jgi:hypothetical protein